MHGSSPPTAFGPFRVRGFRFQWPADLLTSWAFEMETLALGWYVLTATGSVLLLTVFGALQYLGTLIAPVLGVVGDRIGQRRLLCALRASYAALAAVLMTLAFADALNPLLVLLVAGLSGVVRPADQGIRAALIADIMPGAQLPAAMAVSRTTSDSARIAGALAGAGLLAAVGMGAAYIVVTTFYALGALLTLGSGGAARTSSATARSPWRDLRDGLSYVWATPSIRAAMWIAFLINLCAFPLSTGLLPYVARDVLHTDQTGLGYLIASFSTGALVGSLTLTIIGWRLLPGRMVIVWGIGWYASLLLFAFTQTSLTAMLALLLTGFVQSLTVIPLFVVLLRVTDPAFRGRVMGVRMLAIYSLPIGLIAAGFLIPAVGFTATLAAYALFGIACVAIIGVRWRKHLWARDALANTA